jgi:hypothetical protein
VLDQVVDEPGEEFGLDVGDDLFPAAAQLLGHNAQGGSGQAGRDGDP